MLQRCNIDGLLSWLEKRIILLKLPRKMVPGNRLIFNGADETDYSLDPGRQRQGGIVPGMFRWLCGQPVRNMRKAARINEVELVNDCEKCKVKVFTFGDIEHT